MDKRKCSDRMHREARAKMGYWRYKDCPEHMYAMELAYALIYNNVNPSMAHLALATMGLASFPNVMLLVQVDDFFNTYSRKPARGGYIKEDLRTVLQSAIDDSCYAGFAANLTGLDTMVCFLCLPEQSKPDSAFDQLLAFSNLLCHAAETQTGVPVTVGISDFCHTLADYPSAYEKVQNALWDSFYLGKSTTSISGRSNAGSSEKEPPYAEVHPTDFYPPIAVALSKGDEDYFQSILEKGKAVIHAQKLPPKQVKSNMVGLVHYMELYAKRCGLRISEDIAGETAQKSEDVLHSGYLEEIFGYLTEYFLFLAKKLQGLPGRDQAQVFRELVKEYVRTHLAEEITLPQIAKVTGYSTYYFSRTFKQHFSCTLTEYLVQRRIDQSKELLAASAESIGAVAEKCGFESANYFSRCFRSRTGISPSQYRKQNSTVQLSQSKDS